MTGGGGFGINVIGNVSGNLGLGVLARHVITALHARGCPVSLLDIDPGKGRAGHDRRFAEYTVGSARELPYPVTLLISPPNAIAAFLRDRRNRDLLFRDDGLNAALVNWEQMVVPGDWARVMGGLDVVVAPSEFTRATFAEALPSVPVLSTRVPLRIPDTVTVNRTRFGLQRDRVWFGSSFEPQSDPTRKNPFAVLDAFEHAFPSRPDVGLMIKVNNAIVDGRPHPIMDNLRSRSQRDRRIVLLEDSLPYESVLSLYASLDVYVSLHRSEGIGLGMIEAMLLGKPVIATGWSGNMSYMNRSNSCVVAYNLVPVRAQTYEYSQELLGPRAVWADPDITNAAEWMRVLVEHPEVRAAIGLSARESMVQYQAEAERGLFLDELRGILESEVIWGIGAERRKARRHQLERSIAEGEREHERVGATWIGRARSLAKKVGFQRSRLSYWTPPRGGKS